MIYKLKKIKLAYGEILLVSFDPIIISPGRVENIEKTLHIIFPDNKCVLYTKGLEFSTIKLLAKEHDDIQKEHKT